ncbi:reverse transcriptase domain-containing protein [Tanacetum coccineum]
MTDVPRHIAEHRLNVREGCSPVRQKKRRQTTDRNQAIQEEVGKLVELEDVHRFQRFIKACPKDGYPLPKIDWKVESLCGFPFKCFLDAYKGYHQIQMAKEDEEKTAFITSQGIFCYTKMPFGLRNAGETYQRLVDKAFHKQIGRNLEVYVDDLVIKIRTKDEIVREIEETFKTLWEINMKLNPKKCTFRVEEGMFLGYKVNTKGLKVCPDKVDAVLSLPSLKCLKDVQKLNGKLASLNRFLAKSAEKSLPFFKTLKKCTKKSEFHWTIETEEAFKQMKQLIAKLPMLTTPMEKEELIVYLAPAKETVHAVLMTEREAKQMPIYFVSRALRGLEVNYTSMKKLVLALVHASKRLKRYFQEHPIIVTTDQPIQQILEDFIVERLEEESSDTLMEVEEELPEPWILFTDGSSCTNDSGAGLILTNPEGIEITYALIFRFDATNNEAEYEDLIAGLRIAEQIGVKNIQANVDSRLVANHMNGTYVSKEADMIRYLEKVRALTSSFKAFSIRQIPRMVKEEGDTWMTPIFEYLKDETLPTDVEKARAGTNKSVPRLSSSQTCAKKSTIKVNSNHFSMVVLQMGIDIAGPFPKGPGKVKFLIVAMDYCGLKQNQSQPSMAIRSKNLYGTTSSVYLGSQERSSRTMENSSGDNPFKDWCEKLCIRQHFASVKHPQTNGLVERANRNLGEGIKAILGSRNKKWME